MTIAVSQIGWGKYLDREGPFFRGSVPFTLSSNPTDNEKYLAVIAAAESPYVNAVNSYDRATFSAGIIQLAEGMGQYFVSDLLGGIHDVSPDLLKPLDQALFQSNATFSKNGKLRYRFFFKDSRGEVDTSQEQQQLFHLHSDGTIGSWDDASRTHAKVWAACVATTLGQPEAITPQVEFTAKRLMNFVSSSAKASLWDSSDPVPNTGWVGCMRAAFLSFAINSPATASKELQLGISSTKATKWDPDWVVAIIKQMVFGSGIAIWPNRFNAIRPVLEKNYGVDLPDMSADLQHWKEQQDRYHVDPTSLAPSFTDTTRIQKELIEEGYDLGPSGADGSYGGKTKEAVMLFQGLHQLEKTGMVDNYTRVALIAEWHKRNG